MLRASITHAVLRYNVQQSVDHPLLAHKVLFHLGFIYACSFITLYNVLLGETNVDYSTVGNGRQIFLPCVSILPIANGRPFAYVKQRTSYNSGTRAF